jgi:chromosome segregation ATPase
MSLFQISILIMLDTKPGADAYKVVPESQLIVTRTAYKNNSSKYAISGRTSTYSEVQALLKGRGIDLDHNRFLILQVRLLLTSTVCLSTISLSG